MTMPISTAVLEVSETGTPGVKNRGTKFGIGCRIVGDAYDGGHQNTKGLRLR